MSILITFWSVRIVRKTLSDVVRTVIEYQYYNDLSVLLEFIYDLGKSVLTTSLGVMGLGFGLICVGYLHSRYQYQDVNFLNPQE